MHVVPDHLSADLVSDLSYIMAHPDGSLMHVYLICATACYNSFVLIPTSLKVKLYNNF